MLINPLKDTRHLEYFKFGWNSLDSFSMSDKLLTKHSPDLGVVLIALSKVIGHISRFWDTLSFFKKPSEKEPSQFFALNGESKSVKLDVLI